MKVLKKDKRIPCEIYSRVVGYFRPTSEWNAAKKEEFNDRVPYKLDTKEEHYKD